MISRISLGISTVIAAFSASAQLPVIDIGLFDIGGGLLEVRVRPDANFDGVVSSSVFTLRWEAASGASLGNESQPVDVIPYHSINKSGPEVDDGVYRYQPFVGFGFASLLSEGTSWLAGNEYVLCTIPVVNGSSLFEIVNDPWTAANNADYFVSLNGESVTVDGGNISITGSFYSNPSLLIEGATSTGTIVDLQPNPANTSTNLTLSAASAADVEVRLVDPAGRSVWQRNYPTLTGRQQETIDLTGLGAGTYLLRVTSAGGAQVHRLVVQ